MRNDPTLRRLIPVTPLRHFYDRLRDFESQSFHREALRECLRRPDQLQKLIAASVRHFGLYDNREETFHDRIPGLTAARAENSDLANRTLRLMALGAVGVPSHPALELKFDFVDYDVSPIRTTESEFENGIPATGSGRGGVDALLAARDGRLPIIGELKADTDRNPFLGFIQSLTYAVELSSTSQRSRLEAAYPKRFAWPERGPYIDIALLLIRYPNDPAKVEFLKLVRGLVEKLAVPDTPFSHLVRRVLCLRTEMTTPESVEFAVEFVVPGSVTPPSG